MDEVREKEVELMRRLIRTLEDENNSKNLERNTLHLELDRLEGENADLRRQLQREKRNSRDLTGKLEELPVQVELELEELRSNHQSQLQEIAFLKSEVERISIEKSQSHSKSQHQRTQLQKQLASTKKRLSQQSATGRMLDTQSDILREKELKIQHLQKSLQLKDQQLAVFSKDVEELRARISELSDEVQMSKLQDTQGQLSQYQKELLLSRRNYDELKHSTTIRIELLEHKLQSLNNELTKMTEQKSAGLLEREQLGRTVAQLRQQNHSLTQQLQSIRQQYEDVLKDSIDSGNGSSMIRLHSQEVETLRQELSSLISINLTLSNELSLARENIHRRSRMHSDHESSRYLISERGSRIESVRGESPLIHERTSHFAFQGMRTSKMKRDNSNLDEKLFERQMKKLRQEMSTLKMQNERVNRRNMQLADMNDSLLRGNTSVQLLKKQLNPGLIRVEEDSIEEEKKPNRLIRRTNNRQQRLTIHTEANDDLRTSKRAESKAKWVEMQKRLSEMRMEDQELMRVTPSKRQPHQQS